jgi:hypothetical protein
VVASIEFVEVLFKNVEEALVFLCGSHFLAVHKRLLLLFACLLALLLSGRFLAFLEDALESIVDKLVG